MYTEHSTGACGRVLNLSFVETGWTRFSRIRIAAHGENLYLDRADLDDTSKSDPQTFIASLEVGSSDTKKAVPLTHYADAAR